MLFVNRKMEEFSVEQVRPGLFCIHSQLNASKLYSQINDSMDKKEGAGNNTFAGLSTTNSAVSSPFAGFFFGQSTSNIPKSTGKFVVSNLSCPSIGLIIYILRTSIPAKYVRLTNSRKRIKTGSNPF